MRKIYVCILCVNLLNRLVYTNFLEYYSLITLIS